MLHSAKTWSESPPPSVWCRRVATLVVEQCVEHVQRLARGGGDQLGVERRVAVRQVGIDLEAGSLAVMGVQAGGIAAEAGGLEELAVR